MMPKYPDRRGLVYTKVLTIRCEPELWDAFERLKAETKKDVPEAQRIALRELTEKLKHDAEAS